jgi:YesN/AraC family two-component response regulator
MLREALVGMLKLSGFEVVGAVADGADATSLATELAPDLVLMDLSMPVLNGLTRPGCCARSRPTRRL